MRILILGGDGMLGHQLLCSWQERHEVAVTLRRPLQTYSEYGIFTRENSYDAIDARELGRLHEVLRDFQPEVVVNAVGIVKQRDEAHAAIPSIEVNALLPHRLHAACAELGVRLVHLSTDCVFSGDKGGYREGDLEDARDLYGRSKLLGELRQAPAITLRTSIIGLELSRKKSLIEWFLAQHGRIQGYRRAIYSGFTTIEMARIIERILTRHADMYGLWHVASQPISKYDLLLQLAHLLHKDIEIVADDSFVCDRSLDASRFNAHTGYRPPTWDVMLAELAEQVRERKA
ncbi:MAG: SDR family oxidoreductase [Zetaproteobacteria bacterium]|nr:MAG: SDR family oxidoreductase [Zetaproteobacteria bacterium]